MSEETKKLAAKCLLSGFTGTELPSQLVPDLEKGAFGGVVLFRRNVENYQQVHALLSEIKERMPEGEQPVCAVDQEGGRVIRLREPLTVLPPARILGDLDNPELTFNAGKLVGRELRAVGFTMNFAPLLDVNTNPDSPVIGDRAFGADVTTVVRHGLAFARGLKEGGVFPCAKHFPGHGDADVDSHKGLPVVSHSAQRLESIEIEPFAAWARTALGPVMTAHVVYPELDLEYPATMSRKILTGILRERHHFSGVILTDDLEMGAIKNGIGAATAAVQIIRAGADGLLVCSDLDLRQDIIKNMAHEADRDSSFHAKLTKAALQLSRLAHPAGPDIPISFIKSDVHIEMSQMVMDQVGDTK